MLDKQYYMYSVDTSHFYSNHEARLHEKSGHLRQELTFIHSKLLQIEQELKQFGYSGSDVKKLKKEITETPYPTEVSHDMISQYQKWAALAEHKKEVLKRSKEQLLTLLSNKTHHNGKTDGTDHIRILQENRLHDTNVISVFDSALSRTIGIDQDDLTDALIVVQVYYYDVFKDISFYGFLYKGCKYQYFTSSAGQIRQKKAIFIKESVWNTIEKTIMCGLTIDTINQKGGNNVNKHLAYLALVNSATDAWDEFDIDRTIVIDDFQTMVPGTFDLVNETDYSITRTTGSVPITHTDGAGMILPAVSRKNFMFRAPWIKGLLGVFDFRKFIEVHHCSPIITDIYGQDHHLVDENIEIIFTKSQFKMYPYYNSWDEYKKAFKKYHCSAGRCNLEEDRIKHAKINYQMLQTLTDITDDEIDLLTQKSRDKINNICTSKEAMLDILGITPYNTNMTPFQKAVKLYPPLLGDPYTKDMLRDIKNSLLRKYRSGKLEITGKYTFILPDYYAACEYWFCHIKMPKGLLDDQEVFCWLFRQQEKLDCLRSPHLYREHAIRFNTAGIQPASDSIKSRNERRQQLREWFQTNALYTSTHDLISKLLQFDCDGDKALVIADPDFIRIAERNMKHVVPLYYHMQKAQPSQLNHQTIYDGLNQAFASNSIGIYSNDISKIWNHDVFISGTWQEKQEAINTIKLLCMENNFAIDSAKTLYMPERAPWFHSVVSKYTSDKLPAFFQFAKDKEPTQIMGRNQSFVNKIFDRIPDKPINTRGLNLGRIEYQTMMRDSRIVCSKEVSELYNQLNRQYRYMLSMKDDSTGNLRYVACEIRSKFNRLGYSDETIADMLVQYLYGKEKRYKQLLWFCYGSYITANLEKSQKVIRTRVVECVDCGEWFETSAANRRTCRCNHCQKLHNRAYERAKKQRQRQHS